MAKNIATLTVPASSSPTIITISNGPDVALPVPDLQPTTSPQKEKSSRKSSSSKSEKTQVEAPSTDPASTKTETKIKTETQTKADTPSPSKENPPSDKPSIETEGFIKAKEEEERLQIMKDKQNSFRVYVILITVGILCLLFAWAYLQKRWPFSITDNPTGSVAGKLVNPLAPDENIVALTKMMEKILPAVGELKEDSANLKAKDSELAAQDAILSGKIDTATASISSLKTDTAKELADVKAKAASDLAPLIASSSKSERDIEALKNQIESEIPKLRDQINLIEERSKPVAAKEPIKVEVTTKPPEPTVIAPATTKSPQVPPPEATTTQSINWKTYVDSKGTWYGEVVKPFHSSRKYSVDKILAKRVAWVLDDSTIEKQVWMKKPWWIGGKPFTTICGPITPIMLQNATHVSFVAKDHTIEIWELRN